MEVVQLLMVQLLGCVLLVGCSSSTMRRVGMVTEQFVHSMDTLIAHAFRAQSRMLRPNTLPEVRSVSH